MMVFSAFLPASLSARLAGRNFCFDLLYEGRHVSRRDRDALTGPSVDVGPIAQAVEERIG